MSELGLDAVRNGEGGQARSLDWQVRTAFAAGCGGVFVFAWTDEWYRHGHDVEDWAFGLTRADRSPKPALETVREAFAEAPFAPSLPWPRISVVVCSCNGGRTIRDACEGLRRLDYPNYEVIVVDDGSNDDTAAIAGQYDVRLIRTPNRGLSSARNTGLAAATGEIVAYLDDDAYPDPHWLTYLAATFLSTSHVGVGGPNIAPAGDGPIAECVARAPGGPVHVLVTDREAEHIPGCNMAFRTAFLEAVGGFDSRFRSAGDDVDVCWRLQDRGWTLGFHPAVPFCLAAILPSVAQACLGGARARFPDGLKGMARLARRVLTAGLHFIQPIARLRGRIQEGLTPWRRRCPRRPGPLWPVIAAVWSEHWLDQDQRLRAMETDLRADGVCVLRGARDARWDLEVRGGFFGAARLLMGVEEHAGGKQLIRVRWWPVLPAAGPLLTLVFAVLTRGALGDQARVAAAVLGLGALLSAARVVEQCSAATATIREVVGRLRRSEAL